MDEGTTWSVTGTLAGSGQTIRWATDNQTSGDAVNNGDVEMTYYAQENTIFKFGGALGSGYSSPSVTYEQFGVERTTGVNTYVWADIGSNYTFQQTLPGSTSSIRWVTVEPSGVIGPSQVITATYYEQAAVSLTTIEDNATSPIPVSYTSFGRVQTANTPLSTWMDFNTQYRLMLTNSTDIRYIFGGSEPSSGIVDGPLTMTYQIYPQDLINETTSAGTLSTSAIRWVNNTQPISFTAKHIDGWQFSGWVGSVDSTNKTVTVQPAPGLKMTAVYDPGLTISASSGGSVDVSYGSSTVVVPAGQTPTIYVPVGTIVTLSATPSNPLYKFDGWNGMVTTQATPALLKMSEPATVTGAFSYNTITIGIISAFGLIVIGLVVTVLRRSH